VPLTAPSLLNGYVCMQGIFTLRSQAVATPKLVRSPTIPPSMVPRDAIY